LEITFLLEASDRYRAAELGVNAGAVVLYVERVGGTDLAFIGQPAEMQRLARALDQAAEQGASRALVEEDVWQP
jgi:hypothetical protein